MHVDNTDAGPNGKGRNTRFWHASEVALHRVFEVLRGRRLVALTGAGCSTESGIPDYRGAGHPPRRSPIQHDAFVRRPEVRQRYWARATLGWGHLAGARPNPAHGALAELERAGLLAGVITQNVDRLHHAAGSRRVVELHGALAEVRCLGCGATERRPRVHERMLAANPGWLERVASVAPDGDAELPAADVAAFSVVACVACGGALKPDVVFFGGHVGAPTLADAWALLDEAQALLVVGTSLAVLSGFRFVRRAAERALPIAIVNRGPTRGDELAAARWDAVAGEALPQLYQSLLARGPGEPHLGRVGEAGRALAQE
jgi:NAD-dependent SIR2 family protein deacetylase